MEAGELQALGNNDNTPMYYSFGLRKQQTEQLLKEGEFNATTNSHISL